MVEIGQTEVKNVEYYQLSDLGVAKINHCNNVRNTPLILHESCANDERFFKSLTNKIDSVQEDDCCMIDARNDNISVNVLKTESKFCEYYFLIFSSWRVLFLFTMNVVDFS